MADSQPIVWIKYNNNLDLHNTEAFLLRCKRYAVYSVVQNYGLDYEG